MEMIMYLGKLSQACQEGYLYKVFMVMSPNHIT